MSTKNKAAYTLVELLVVMLVSSILIVISVSTYNLFSKSMAADQSKAAISQNARVALDRMTREIRQTPLIITELPEDAEDTSIAQPGYVEFEDGHAQDLTYRRYYVSDNVLKMDTNEYYFSYDTATRVRWNAAGVGGITPTKHVISTQDIADTVQSLSFYGTKPLGIVLVTGDGSQTFTLRTSIYERNL
jgi:prepilin-type N-terminal cleavage/methylation domain-containing protein